MHTIKVRNVNQALPAGLQLLNLKGCQRESRNGKVAVMPVPVTTLYTKPTERVLFSAEREANPFFHFYESIWMLGGRNDVATLTNYVKRMQTFSDDGITLHGAYGYRWRRAFGGDQLFLIIEALKKDPTDRRNVLQMWDANLDLGRIGKDIPCNTHIYFLRNEEGALDMTVCCRSNDMIFGAYGANVVHMSMLQEYMAGGIGCEVGHYWQISNNYHAYLDTLEPLKQSLANKNPSILCPYSRGEVKPYPMMDLPYEEWDKELEMFLDEGLVLGMKSKFLRKVAGPILEAHRTFKENKGQLRYDLAEEIINNCAATDWRLACLGWISRRKDRFNKASDDGVSYE